MSNEYQFALKLVELHDQEGMPLELTLEMAAEAGRRPALLGLLVGMAARGYSHKYMKTVVGWWSRRWNPTKVEHKAMEAVLAGKEM